MYCRANNILKNLGVKGLMSRSIKKHLLFCIFRYFTYQGSQTIPPCSENVKWYVIASICHVPTNFMLKLKNIQKTHNNRIIQPLNERTVDGIMFIFTLRFVVESDRFFWKMLQKFFCFFSKIVKLQKSVVFIFVCSLDRRLIHGC